MEGENHVKDGIVNGKTKPVLVPDFHAGQVHGAEVEDERRKVIGAFVQGNLIVFVPPAVEIHVCVNHVVGPVVIVQVGGRVAALVGVAGEFERFQVLDGEPAMEVFPHLEKQVEKRGRLYPEVHVERGLAVEPQGIQVYEGQAHLRVHGAPLVHKTERNPLPVPERVLSSGGDAPLALSVNGNGYQQTQYEELPTHL